MRAILTEMELRDIVYHFTVKSNAYKKFVITQLVESGGKLVI